MKILISFIAVNNDFKEGSVNPDGPTYQFHKNFYSHDQHILIAASNKEETQMAHLLTTIKKDFPGRSVKETYVGITDVIDLAEVKSKLERLILEYKEDEIDIFFSPGTSIMQLSWYILHSTLGLKTRLLQTRAAKHTKAKKPELIIIETEKSSVPYSAIIKQKETTRRDEDYLITESIKPAYDIAEKISKTEDTTTLIIGDSGTGKEHLANFIHKNSSRKNNPFIAINCSAFSDQLLESRLFGYKKGSFTGADKDSKGLFEEAEGGTLFLDEIGDISSYMQQSLLRVLQQKEITPIGGKAKKVDVRIVAATNKNLPEMCKNEKFRWDLYYRLAVVDLHLPKLSDRSQRERKELLESFLKNKAKKFKRPTPLQLEKEALNKILLYHFPGNVRELENLIERLYVLCNEKATTADLPTHIKSPQIESPLILEEVEKQHIKYVLDLKKGNQRQAALALGIALNTLKAKVKESNE